MGEPRDLDELLARSEVVDAAPHTARRAVGLGVGLVTIGAAIAVAVTTGGSAAVASVVASAMASWADQF